MFRKPKKLLAPTPIALDPEQAWKILSLVVDWIKHAETKSGLTLAAAGVGGGILYNLMQGRSLGGCELVIPVAVGALFLISGSLGAAAIWPRLRSSGDPVSLIYFDHVARTEGGRASYVHGLSDLSRSPDSVVREVGSQIWEMSKVARKKFFWAGLAIRILLSAYGGLALLAILLIVR